MPQPDKNKYVLIIEDEKKDSDKIAASFDNLSIPYKVATNASGALQTASQGVPAVIIMDLMLPGLNGFKLGRLLKADERFKDAPIIVISELDSAANTESAKQIGIEEYLVKPVDLKKLLEIVKKYI